MGITIISTIEALLLTAALTTDAFTASFAYGTNKIKIPFLSLMIINIICTSTLMLSLFIGYLIRPFLPSQLTNIICFLILLILGIIKLFDSSIKTYIRRKKGINTKINFSLFQLNFILTIYADPEEADCDFSRSLSPFEAVSLAIALSLDGLAVGFGAALSNINYLEVIVFSLLLGIIAVKLGFFIGNKIAEKLSINLSYLSGIFLILFAFIKLH
ncbi:sporulation membrane protein YtaF [Anaerovorax odorimutans]|uniref:sporulation membrane protein YtaF n=1 Tax=Anaerovorax odorimutans TaxID=109327 RepID=UPI00040CFD5F|nr:sporulation membrane protein YtaF [Anaerovorax odorimutans]